MCKQIKQYLSQHPYFNGGIHILVGIGVGMLLTYPLAGAHPVRWGIGFIVLGILGHLYPLVKKG